MTACVDPPRGPDLLFAFHSGLGPDDTGEQRQARLRLMSLHVPMGEIYFPGIQDFSEDLPALHAGVPSLGMGRRLRQPDTGDFGAATD